MLPVRTSDAAPSSAPPLRWSERAVSPLVRRDGAYNATLQRGTLRPHCALQQDGARTAKPCAGAQLRTLQRLGSSFQEG